jgi:hypothetical protein
MLMNTIYPTNLVNIQKELPPNVFNIEDLDDEAYLQQENVDFDDDLELDLAPVPPGWG